MVKSTSYLAMATGRRKRSIASVRIKKGDGKIMVNGKNVDKYFPHSLQVAHATKPISLYKDISVYDLVISVNGGGLMGQAGAVLHGIARVIIKHDPTLRPIIKKNGYLTRDNRKCERQKYGQPGARKSFQFSKR